MSNPNQTAETIHNAGKAKLVNSLRLMGDNQRTLNRTGNEDARLRDLHIREQEAEAKKRHPNLPDPSPVTEELMDIRVDSPTTINHNYPEPTSVPKPAEPVHAIRDKVKSRPSWLLPAALVVGSALTGGAVPTALLVYQAIKASSEPTPPPVVVDHDTTRRIDIEKYIPPPREPKGGDQ